MNLLGYMLLALVLIIGVAVVYDLRARRRHRGLSGEFREEGRQNALRDEQNRRSPAARTRPEDRLNDGYGGGVQP